LEADKMLEIQKDRALVKRKTADTFAPDALERDAEKWTPVFRYIPL
jgi:hypothetical protein